jgi:hypothetical protein
VPGGVTTVLLFTAAATVGAAVTAWPDAAAAAAVPPGYYVDSLLAATPRPTWSEEKDGDFTYSIRRGCPDSTTAWLLGVAEAVCPPRDLLARIAARNGFEIGSDTAGVSLWWCKGVGASRVPFAVTAGALEHYLGLVQLYRERRFREAGTRPLHWSELVYRATIAERDTFRLGDASFTGVHVATLTLSWAYDDGTFRPEIEAHRVVVLSPRGEILAVDGDGSAMESVSISTHRGVGREERILR